MWKQFSLLLYFNFHVGNTLKWVAICIKQIYPKTISFISFIFLLSRNSIKVNKFKSPISINYRQSMLLFEHKR